MRRTTAAAANSGNVQRGNVSPTKANKELQVAKMERDAAIEQAVGALVESENAKKECEATKATLEKTESRQKVLLKDLETLKATLSSYEQKASPPLESIIEATALELLGPDAPPLTSVDLKLKLLKINSKLKENNSTKKNDQSEMLTQAYEELIQLNQHQLELQDTVSSLQSQLALKNEETAELSSPSKHFVKLLQSATQDFQRAAKKSEERFEKTLSELKEAHATEMAESEARWAESFESMQNGYRSAEQQQDVLKDSAEQLEIVKTTLEAAEASCKDLQEKNIALESEVQKQRETLKTHAEASQADKQVSERSSSVIKELRDALSAKNEELHASITKINELEDQVHLGAAAGESELVSTQLKMSEERVKKVLGQLTEKNKELVSTKHNISVLQDKLQSASIDSVSQAAKVSELETQVESDRKTLQELRLELQSSEVRVVTLQKSVDDKVKVNKKLAEELKGVKNALSDRDGLVNSLQEEVQDAESQLEDLGSVSKQAKRLGGQNEKLSRQVKTLKAELSTVKNFKDDLVEKLEVLSEKYEALEQKDAEDLQKLAKGDRLSSELATQLDICKQELSLLESQKHDGDVEVQSLRMQLIKVQNELRNVESKAASVTQNLKESEARVTSIQTAAAVEKEAAVTNDTSLKARLDADITRIAQLESEVQKLRENSRHELDSNVGEINTLRDRASAAEAQVETTRSELEARAAVVKEQHDVKLKALGNEIEQLNNVVVELSSLKDQNNSNNSTLKESNTAEILALKTQLGMHVRHWKRTSTLNRKIINN